MKGLFGMNLDTDNRIDIRGSSLLYRLNRHVVMGYIPFEQLTKTGFVHSREPQADLMKVH